ncbi:cell surface glycoprotein [Halorhabdus tiamatea SARL4B]|uniref:Cell surface glycoprotein n=1 Tax=Halorhabdus tiamatea SARL4B TaxID=1033806 RepID=U2F9Y1_9EURY|nr:carboxypeptidase-like regulatory domain-containing protein [Halorhabdus tiamatea]ERJ06870.1 cell surface glycoprotein [Halorhabdus tiamatea SARL4B]
MTGNSTPQEKVRAVFLATLMVLSVFAMSAAFAGAAAAGNSGGDWGTTLPAVGGTDYTDTGSTTTEAVSEIANVTFSSEGDINNVTVNATGGNEGNVPASAIDEVTVSLNTTDGVVTDSEIYDSHDTLVDFADVDGNVTNVSDLIVKAQIAQNAANNSVIDANLTVKTNPSGWYDTDGTQTILNDNIGYFSGLITDQNNNPIPAEVIVEGDDSTTSGIYKTTTANDNGQYTIGVPEGNYTVTANLEGYNSASPKDSEVTAGETTSANFVLEQIINAGEIDVTPSTDSAEADGSTEVEYEIELFDDDDGSPYEDDVEVTVDAPDEGAITLSDTTVTTTDGNATVTATSSEIQAAEFTFTAQSNESVSETVTTQFVAADGNLALYGDVQEWATNADVEGATVWAAYPGVNQTQAFAEEETNLSTMTAASGEYQISGINENRLGANNALNVYVAASGYNSINGTAADGNVTGFGNVSQYYATNAQVSMNPAGSDVDNTTSKDFTVSPVEITPVYDVTVDVTQDGDSIARMPTQDVADVEYEVLVKADTDPDSEFEPVSESDLVTPSEVDVVFNITTNTSSGNLLPADANDQVVTYGDDVQFETTRTPSPDNVTINASVVNENDQEFNDSTGVEVYGVGEITGDVVNDDSPADNLPGASVTLIKEPDTANEEIVANTTTGPEGSYSFTEVETGFDYRIDAEFEGETGFNDITKNTAGTTNADVVIVGVEAPKGFTVVDINPANVTVTQGDVIDVTATINNDAPDEDTRDVEFRVTDSNGSEVVSITESVTLQPGENTYTFSGIDTSALAAGNYTHGVYTDTNSQTATLTVESSSGGDVTFQDVLGVITDYNNDDASFQDVLDVITAYNNS